MNHCRKLCMDHRAVTSTVLHLPLGTQASDGSTDLGSCIHCCDLPHRRTYLLCMPTADRVALPEYGVRSIRTSPFVSSIELAGNGYTGESAGTLLPVREVSTPQHVCPRREHLQACSMLQDVGGGHLQHPWPDGDTATTS